MNEFKKMKLEDTSNNKVINKKRGKFKKGLLYTRCFLPFLLSHHPECEIFGKSHTINIGKYRFCIGCFVGYTAAIITYLILTIFNLRNAIPDDYQLILSLIFIGTFILSPLKLTKIKAIKIFQKIFIGIGAILLFFWIRNLPNPEMTNRIMSMLVLSFMLGILNLHHAMGFLSKCYKCKTPFDWGKCPGFKSVTKNMEKYKLNNFLLQLEDFSNKIIEKKERKESY